jgi:hypothetical protein
MTGTEEGAPGVWVLFEQLLANWSDPTGKYREDLIGAIQAVLSSYLQFTGQEGPRTREEVQLYIMKLCDEARPRLKFEGVTLADLIVAYRRGSWCSAP